MFITSRKIAQGLVRALNRTPGQEKQILINFHQLIIKKNWQSRWPQIIAEVNKLVARLARARTVKVTTAQAVNKQTVDLLTKQVSQSAEVKLEVNEKLIGGFVLEGEGLIIDASLKKQLQNFNL